MHKKLETNVILLAIAVPRVDTTRFQVDAGAQEVQASVTLSRGEALLRQQDVVLTFDVTENVIYVLNDANNNGVFDTGEQRRMVQFPEAVEFGRGGAAAINGATAAVSFTKMSESVPSLKFHRNGSASEEGTIYITSTRALGGNGTGFPQDTRALKVQRSTGSVRCYSYRTLAWQEGC